MNEPRVCKAGRCRKRIPKGSRSDKEFCSQACQKWQIRQDKLKGENNE